MGGWYCETPDEYSDRSWPNRQRNGWIGLLIFAMLMLVFLRTGAWWMIFAVWWIIPAFSRGHWGFGCANDGDKVKRSTVQDKPKRGQIYIYGEDGEPLEVVEAPEKPKRYPEDSYDYI